MAARVAAQTICKCGYRGQIYERMQGRLYSSESRFAVDWLDRTVGLGPDRTGLILVRSGPKVKDWTVKQSLFLVQTGLKLL
jgi:hypothetical protein